MRRKRINVGWSALYKFNLYKVRLQTTVSRNINVHLRYKYTYSTLRYKYVPYMIKMHGKCENVTIKRGQVYDLSTEVCTIRVNKT